MYVLNVTDDFNKITLDKYTDLLIDYYTNTHNNYTKILNDYDKMKLSNCTNNVVIIIQTLLFTIPCGQSILCLISLMVSLFTKK